MNILQHWLDEETDYLNYIQNQLKVMRETKVWLKEKNLPEDITKEDLAVYEQDIIATKSMITKLQEQLSHNRLTDAAFSAQQYMLDAEDQNFKDELFGDTSSNENYSSSGCYLIGVRGNSPPDSAFSDEKAIWPSYIISINIYDVSGTNL